MKNLTWQNPEQLFVAQVLINKVKSKCCGIKVNQKTHNDMSINAFPLSPQAGTTWRHAYSNYICFSAKGASLRFYSPSFFCRTIQIGRLLWYILRRWWKLLCQKPSIGRHARSVSCVPFYCWSLWFYYILIRFNLFELTKLRLNVNIKIFHCIYNNF